jgi:hypothetical protein
LIHADDKATLKDFFGFGAGGVPKAVVGQVASGLIHSLLKPSFTRSLRPHTSSLGFGAGGVPKAVVLVR